MMKAAICYAFGEPLVIEDVHIDPPQYGEVKVKICACAICHSAVAWIRGHWGGETPLVVGHEAAGVVTEVGSGVTQLQPGDDVVVYLRRSCGRCFFCSMGRPYNCEAKFPLDRASRLRNHRGTPLIQGFRTAAFAEYAIIDQSQGIKISSSVPLDRACLLACGVITGVGAVMNTVQVTMGSTVVVIGTGGVGLNTVQGAALAGAARIIAVDVLDNKLQAARLFGATHTINARREDAVAKALALTDGRGADYAFVVVGSSPAISQAIEMTRKGGITVIVGIPASEQATFTLNAHHLTEGRAVIGSLVGSARPSIDIPHLIDLYQQGRLKLDDLITRRYPLE